MKKAIWLLIAAMSMTLVSQPTEAQPKRKVVFGVPVTPPNVVHLPPYIAKEMGFFSDLNIDVELVTFEGGTQTLRGSVAGGLDITGTSSDPAIIAAARGAGTKVLGTYSHKLSHSMLVQGDIKSCKELKGRKIGIQEVGAFNDVMSRAVIRAITDIPDPKERAVAILTWIEERTAPQIEEDLGIPASTVRSITKRLRERFRPLFVEVDTERGWQSEGAS